MESYTSFFVFCDWLLSLSRMFSKFIHVVDYSFLFPCNIPLYGYATSHSLVEGLRLFLL